MSTNSNIEWTQATWNPIAGCTPVSPGCLNCYAATMAHRLDKMGQKKYRGLTVLRNGVRTFNGKITLDEEALSIPLKRTKPTVYFVNSMSDLFHEDVPFAFVEKVFDVMWQTEHIFQILTKRPDRMACAVDALLSPALADKMLENIWLGTSVENQACMKRINQLRGCRAVIRFLSLEPLLEDLGALDLRGISWVIVGGESGGSKKSPARPCNIPWVRSIVDQCRAAAVPCFVKQLGSHPIDCTTPNGRTNGHNGYVNVHPGDARGTLSCAFCEPVKLTDRKGGDMNEWPADIRIRSLPASVAPMTNGKGTR